MFFFFLSMLFGVSFNGSRSSAAQPQANIADDGIDLMQPAVNTPDQGGSESLAGTDTPPVVPQNIVPQSRFVPIVDDTSTSEIPGETEETVSDPLVQIPDEGMPDMSGGGIIGSDPQQDTATPDAGDMDDMDHTPATGDMGDMDHTPDSGGMGDMDGQDGHAGHDMTPIAPPMSPAEIDAFVAAVQAAPEMHMHDMGSSKMGEHMAALNLTPRDEATHIAIGDGDWDNPLNWHNGEVPGDDARVLVPEGINITYGHVSEARLFTLRVDGKLDFANDVDSQMIVDTLVISPSGNLTIGTADNPISADVDVDIIFANNGAIDTDWDPMLLSRGMIAHGTVEIFGDAKDSHEKVIDDPMQGDTSVTFATLPEGWQIGDTIVIAGTTYDGQSAGPQDEIRTISDIEGNRVIFDDPLEYDHDAPREDLKTSVANYTRNVSFETEDADTAELFERGHVMFMHNDDVNVNYAEFHELGRTDKSEPARNVDEFDDLAFDSNVKGRYSFHFHRAGLDDLENPGIANGNAVFGSPGWGFVHHDSNAIFDNNATYDTFGAGYVAESGNETGAWNDNIAIYAEGNSWNTPKLANDITNFDLGQSGDGFWFQSRMVQSTDNIAASVNHGFVYFHRGDTGEDGMIKFDANEVPFGDFLNNDPSVRPDEYPVLSFDGNEAFAARTGLHVVKANPNQLHDVHSVFEDFTAWSVTRGAEFEYTSHYTIKDFDLIGKEDGEEEGERGILFGNNVSDMTVVDSKIANFNTGINLFKGFVQGDPAELHQYTIVNQTFENVGTEYGHLDLTLDKILETSDLPGLTPDITLDGPLTYSNATREVEITGTKTDSLGTTDFPSGIDDYTIEFFKAWDIMKEDGVYTTSDGQNYFMLDIYFSDRVTGDIFVETHPVLLDDDVRPGRSPYESVKFNGIRDFGDAEDTSSDAAKLWATLTDGQIILAEDPVDVDEDPDLDPGDI